MPKKSREERFWEKVDKDGPVLKPQLGKCWLWKGTIDYHGYGKFSTGTPEQRGKDIPAHRFAYESSCGLIPPGLELDHLCRNPSCVNPSHLEPVARKTNVQRGVAGATESAKTHCPQGHPYDLLNTYYDNRGRRNCRTCRQERGKQAYLLKKTNKTP